jgi:hypothetical protein
LTMIKGQRIGKPDNPNHAEPIEHGGLGMAVHYDQRVTTRS